MKYKILKAFTAVTLLSDGNLVEFTPEGVPGGTFDNASELFTAEEILAHIEAGELESVLEYTVTQEDLDTNPYLASLGAEVGETVMFDPAIVLTREDAIAVGINVEVIENKEEIEVKKIEVEQPHTDTISAESKKFYEGKLIVVDTYRTVNDKQYRHIRLEDGTTQDLTEEQYNLGVTYVE